MWNKAINQNIVASFIIFEKGNAITQPIKTLREFS